MPKRLEHNEISIKAESKIKNIYDKMDKPFIYSLSDYNLPTGYTGEGVRICLIDSGSPDHNDISIIGEHISFCEDSKSLVDKNGHATIVTGIIGAKNRESIVGLAPNAQISFVKVMDDAGKFNFNSLIAAVLWGIVKQFDIIFMPFCTKYDHSIFHDAIQKAHKLNIFMIAAVGNNTSDNEIDYPAGYVEVCSVGSKGKNTKDKADFSVASSNLFTTYVDNKYVQVSGTSAASAIVCGLAAILIEQKKKENKPVIIKEIYSELHKILK